MWVLITLERVAPAEAEEHRTKKFNRIEYPIGDVSIEAAKTYTALKMVDKKVLEVYLHNVNEESTEPYSAYRVVSGNDSLRFLPIKYTDHEMKQKNLDEMDQMRLFHEGHENEY